MNPEQSIQLFTILFYIFLAVMIVGFGLAVFYFFYYRIPQVYALLTGRAQRKTVEKMQKSGRLISEEERMAENDAHIGAENGVIDVSDDYITERIGNVKPVHVGAQQLSNGAGGDSAKTTILEAETETTVLAPEQETSVLSQETEAIVPGSYVGVSDETEGFDETGPQYYFKITQHTMVIHTNEEI